MSSFCCCLPLVFLECRQLLWPRRASNIHSASRVLIIPVIAAVRSTVSKSAWPPRPVRTLNASLTHGTKPLIMRRQRKTESRPSPPIPLSLWVPHLLHPEINRRRWAALKRAHNCGAGAKAQASYQAWARCYLAVSVCAMRFGHPGSRCTTFKLFAINARRLHPDSGGDQWE